MKHPHEFYLSELQLHMPFSNEAELEPESVEICKLKYDEISEHNGIKKTTNVKNLLMEHIESVVEGTEKAQKLVDSNVGDTLDTANAQDNDDCEEEGVSDHNDFLAKNPDELENKDNVNKDYTYKKIQLYDNDTLEDLTRNMDEDQRIVLDKSVDFAMNVVKCRNKRQTLVQPPLLIVQGGAGSGKSTVIDIVSQHVERILRQVGDNPNHPYILKLAFTGTAAANIRGQTLHSAFSFNFGNAFISLNDKARDNKRSVLENMLFVIIDEYSFIDSDMLYKLDLRLKELKQKQTLDFGGVSVLFFGDILQLRPVRARYICEEPNSESFSISHLIDPLWKKFEVIILNKNHRQGKDMEYANILNRIRQGNIQDDDLKVLNTRVRSVNHPDIPKNALIVTCTNKEVNRINKEVLSTISSKEYIIQAMNRSQTQKITKPLIDATGAIRNTPLQKEIRLKIGAKVMLTYNIDTCDCLTNGSFGKVMGFKFGKDGTVTRVIVHFYDEECGREKRKNHLQLQNQYPGFHPTPIEMIEFHYSLSKKQSTGVRNSTVTQFPLRLAFAATAHKVQGQTVKKPNSLVLDLRTVRESAQAYVMLSRVQSLEQLFILESLPADKIYSSKTALDELERLRSISLNKKNLSNKFLVSCNIRSLKAHFQDISTSPYIENAEVICLQETWLKENFNHVNEFNISGFNSHLNCGGRGKGIVTY